MSRKPRASDERPRRAARRVAGDAPLHGPRVPDEDDERRGGDDGAADRWL